MSAARAAWALAALVAAGCGGDDAGSAASTSDGSSTSGGSGGSSTSAGGSTSGESESEGAPLEGSIAVLTYNVAGLPQGISGSNPEVNTPLISPLLNQHELVLVQEDFYYHEALYADAMHPYKSERSGDGLNDLGDGLNFLSMTPLGPLTRVTWEACFGTLGSGSDCLAKKGFAVAAVELAPGVTIDVYDLHTRGGARRTRRRGWPRWSSSWRRSRRARGTGRSWSRATRT